MKTNWYTKTNLMAIAGVLAIGGGIAGCGRDTAERTTTVVTNEQPPAATTTTAPGGTVYVEGQPPTNNVNAGPGDHDGTDVGIANAIERRIVENKQMTGSRIDVVVTGGVATLTGFVQNQQQKALAARAAENTGGVADVKNKIEIRPTGGAKASTPPKVVTKTKTEKVYVPVPVPKVEKETVYVPVPTPVKDSEEKSDDRDANHENETDDTRTAPRTTAPRTGSGGTIP